MNTKTYSLLALAAAAALWPVAALAQYPACPTCVGDPWEMAEEELRSAVPLSIWLDGDSYSMGDVVTISGHVANVVPDYPVTLQVRDPTGNIVAVDQTMVDSDGDFELLLSSSSWTVEGLYNVAVQYGDPHRGNKAQFTLSESSILPACGPSMLHMADACIPYVMTEGRIVGYALDSDARSVILDVSADEDGVVSLEFPEEVVADIFMVLVDGEESNDALVDGQTVRVPYMAGAERIEILAMHVIPEFGVVAALVLAAATVTVVAVSARSGLGLVPRF